MEPTKEPITRDAVESLKAAWEYDPSWDLEEEEGFEEYREELLAYRKAKEAEWEEARNQDLLAKAEKLGCPGNVALVRYVEWLEYRLDELERKTENL